MRPFINRVLQPVWAPVNSPAWASVIRLLTDIYKALDIVPFAQNLGSGSDQVCSNKLMSTVVSSLFANDRVFREVVSVAVAAPDDPVLHDKGFELLHVMLVKLNQLFGHWSAAVGGEAVFQVGPVIQLIN